ncbi:MAG: hypothetical protein GWN61_16060, partial [candidate division Zixibacteria bacterium]|nr:hypothetical protein [candidate division Zixibacteria bacterium]
PDYVKKIEAGHSILVRVTDLCNSQPDTCSRIETATDTLSGGEDGDATKLKASHLTGYENGLLPQPDQLNGLAALEAVEEIGLIGIPDLIVPDFYELTQQRSLPLPQEGIIFAEIPRQELDLVNLKTGQADMLLHCLKKGNRFAILDAPPAAEIGKGKNKIEDWPNHFQLSPAAKYGALYYPWIKQKSDDFQGRELFIPPGGHLAGIYARSELERGIGKSPANEILRGAVELEFCLSDAENAILNPRSVNCLRVLPGRGLRVWGARTLSLESLSRYVNVRRVTLAIVKNILVNIQTLVFEPNDRNLRRTISSTLNTFFLGLFQSGVLAGATPDEAFSVKCDEENNPPEIIDRGQVITDIGFAPAKPAEFIFVTIIRSADSLSVSEQ